MERNRKKKDCDPKLFTKIEIKVGSPLEDHESSAKVALVAEDDIGMERGVHRLYLESYPGLQEIDEDFEVLEQTSSGN